MKTPRRLDGHTFAVTHWLTNRRGKPLSVGDPDGTDAVEHSDDHARHELDVSAFREVDVDPVDGDLRAGPWAEVSFVGRGKIGAGVDLLLQDVGVWVSRLVQGRHPMTGVDLALADPPLCVVVEVALSDPARHHPVRVLLFRGEESFQVGTFVELDSAIAWSKALERFLGI